MLLLEARGLLDRRRRHVSMSEPHKASFGGFDWFVSTIFILVDGEPSKAEAFLSVFVDTMAAMYLWPQRSLMSSLLKTDRDEIPLLYSTSCHLVELIIEAELPNVFSAFTLSGCTPSQVRRDNQASLFDRLINSGGP